MRGIRTSAAAACAALLLGLGTAAFGDAAPGGDGATVRYHGFLIDVAEARGNVDVPSAVRAVEHQIDIVDRAGLSPDLMATFRGVPIRIGATFMGGAGGSHYNGGPDVTLGSMSLGETRPVLLHEYMHVLEYRTFPGGYRNPEMMAFFEEARSGGLYPAESYMMSNPAEFFAMATSCYLNGRLAREPFTRDEIRRRQPDLYAYLERLFGPRGQRAGAD